MYAPGAGRRSPTATFHQDNARYRPPSKKDARALLHEIGPECDVFLLGSGRVAKYVDVLNDDFGEPPALPIRFVGAATEPRGLLAKASEGSNCHRAVLAPCSWRAAAQTSPLARRRVSRRSFSDDNCYPRTRNLSIVRRC